MQDEEERSLNEDDVAFKTSENKDKNKSNTKSSVPHSAEKDEKT